ncbi:cytochrome b/b6 domain-containing protein [Vibrio lentus]|nr:cytochrome b/b6 domain-containing protein [Vibrio lentus]
MWKAKAKRSQLRRLLTALCTLTSGFIYFRLFDFDIRWPWDRGIQLVFTVPSMGELFANQSDSAGTVHYYAAWVLIIMVSVHALAAIKHHVIDKDDTLRK